MNLFKKNISISRIELEAYIGEQAYSPFYTTALDKYMMNSNSLIWNWPSFLIGMYWLMYRKVFIPAIILFLANVAIMTFVPIFIAPFISIAILVFMGFWGTNIFFITAEKEIEKLKSQNPHADEATMLSILNVAGKPNYLYPVIFYLVQGVLYTFIF